MSRAPRRPLLDRRVSLRVVGLILALAALVTIGFGNVAIHVFKGGKKAGRIGDLVLTLSTLPELYRRTFLNADAYLRVEFDHNTFDELGFTFNYAAGTRPDLGYLLLSRWDGDAWKGAVELWDLNTQARVHEWDPDIDAFNRQANLQTAEIDLAVDRAKNRMLIRHPLLLDDGNLVYHSRSPLARIDACNNLVFWNDEDIFHHGLNLDAEGYFWLSTRREPTSVRFVNPETFLDDAVTRVSPEGKIVFQRSLTQLFIDNGMFRLAYPGDTYTDNPIHLNDVQPVLKDGPYWKRGDVFLSLRTPSMIVLYRPSTDQIIWSRQGPWIHQHDVDILDDYRISVFNNNSVETWPFPRTMGYSDVLIYDFRDGSVTSPWGETLAGLNFFTETEGLSEILADGSLMVEEQNSGRILMLAPDKSVLWQYVNGDRNGDRYRTGWSRLIDRERGDRIAAAIAASGCAARG